MRREVRDDKYIALNDKLSEVGLGVAGSAAYGFCLSLMTSMLIIRWQSFVVRNQKGK